MRPLVILLAVMAAAPTASAGKPGKLGVLVSIGPRVGVPLVGAVGGDVGYVRHGGGEPGERKSGFYLQPSARWLRREWQHAFGGGDPATEGAVEIALPFKLAGVSLHPKGALGVQLQLGRHPLAGAAVTLAVRHPALAPVTRRLLDGLDRLRRGRQPAVKRFR